MRRHHQSGPEDSRRGWSLRALVAITAVAATATVTWVVNRALDSGADAIDERALVTAHVEVDPAKVFAGQPQWQTYDFVSSGTPTDLGPPPSAACREWRQWAVRRGGVDADETHVYAYLQGTPGTAVVIDEIEIDIVRRRVPSHGTSAHCSAGGAVGNPRLIDINLDTTRPEVLYAEAGDDYPARRRLNFTLADSESETFRLRAHTTRCDCDWRARVQMVVNGTRMELTLDDAGKPFRTSASRNTKHLAWDGRRWTAMSRADYEGTLPMDWGSFVRQQGE